MKLLFKKIGFFLAPILGYILTLIFYYTNKKIYKIEEELPQEPVIVVLWHGEMLMVPFIYHHLRKREDLVAMISDHKDGSLVGKLFQYTGVGSIRGSSSKGAARVFLKAIKELKNGKDIAITPDGPRGPKFSIADGVGALSNKSGCKIVAIRVGATRAWRFNSWDNFLVPKPFGTITYSVSKAFDVKNLSKIEIQQEILHYLGITDVG